MVQDGHDQGRVMRTGYGLAIRLSEIGAYKWLRAKRMLADSKVGDVVKTGVSAYERRK